MGNFIKEAGDPVVKSFLTERSFWVQTAERAVKTIAQASIAYLATAAIVTGGLIAVNWVVFASMIGLAGLVSVFTSIASGAVGTQGSPALFGPAVDGEESK